MPANKRPDNERKACDAVTRYMEAALNLQRSSAHSPEDDQSGPPVEYVFNLGSYQYALEHTIVEAFPLQIRADIEFADFIAPIVAAVDRKLPKPGTYKLAFAIRPSEGLSGKQIANVQKAIVSWVEKTAAELHAEHPDQSSRNVAPHGFRNTRTDTVGGIDVRLDRETGWWMPEQAKGRLFPIRIAPAGHESLRRDRMTVALDKKLPKLAAWKSIGARSVLILENSDIALSNHVLILEAAEDVMRGRGDIPDEIWLVDTTISEEWTVWCLFRDGVSFPEDETAVRYRDYNTDILTDV